MLVWESLHRLLPEIGNTLGDFCEIGVWEGATFLPLLKHAKRMRRLCHGIDSFIGLEAPGPLDDPERYPEGAYEGCMAEFRESLGADAAHARIWKGHVPEVFAKVQAGPFCFVHVDLDHYEPMLDAMLWTWPRMSKGGLMACHDWIPATLTSATAAVRQFMVLSGRRPTGEFRIGKHVWFRK